MCIDWAECWCELDVFQFFVKLFYSKLRGWPSTKRWVIKDSVCVCVCCFCMDLTDLPRTGWLPLILKEVGKMSLCSILVLKELQKAINHALWCNERHENGFSWTKTARVCTFCFAGDDRRGGDKYINHMWSRWLLLWCNHDDTTPLKIKIKKTTPCWNVRLSVCLFLWYHLKVANSTIIAWESIHNWLRVEMMSGFSLNCKKTVWTLSSRWNECRAELSVVMQDARKHYKTWCTE